MLDTSRETLLRPEFAGQYPNLASGSWMPAAQAVGIIMNHEMRGQTAGSASSLRLSDQHFTFRGGAQRGEDWRLRTRTIDPIQVRN